VKELVSHSGTIVFAGARKPKDAVDLMAVADQHPDRLHIVKLTSAHAEDNAAAAEKIRSVTGRLDVVVANAGQ
jgi:NAD(P)-dependent dehydrogenase (short-subunit alcohol dehydrogenase family)